LYCYTLGSNDHVFFIVSSRDFVNMTLSILVNGEHLEVSDNLVLKELVEILDVKGRYAIEVNGQIVPKSEHLGFTLKVGDTVEIVKAVGGG
jgi:sulfur carrier protein